MQLYATPLSSFSLKVRLAAAWKGVALELLPPPGGYRSAEYRAIVPTGTVPALRLGQRILSESEAIVEYLEETATGPSLLPSEPSARAVARMLSRLHDLRIDPPLRSLFSEAKAEFPELERVAPGVERFRQGLAVVEAMRPATPFMAGEAFTLADCAYAGSFLIARRLLPRLGAEAPLPNWAETWLKRLAAEPSLSPVLADYDEALSGWLA